MTPLELFDKIPDVLNVRQAWAHADEMDKFLKSAAHLKMMYMADKKQLVGQAIDRLILERDALRGILEEGERDVLGDLADALVSLKKVESAL
jgi:hypothetical protein